MDLSLRGTDATSGPVDLLRFTPHSPRKISDTGLPQSFLSNLMLRHLYARGESAAGQLAQGLALPVVVIQSLLNRLRAAGVVEPLCAPDYSGAGSWALSAAGRRLAAEARAAGRYLGPAPVSLADYQRGLALQQPTHSVKQTCLDSAFNGLALEPETLEQLAGALASGRGFVIHGRPGSGRSALVSALGELEPEGLWLPRALLVGDQVMLVYDPDLHRPVGAGGCTDGFRSAEGFSDDSGLQRPAMPGTSGCRSFDERWVFVRTPLVVAGAGHGVQAFDARTDAISGAILAPLHIRAAQGWMVVDDAMGSLRTRRALLTRLAAAVQSQVEMLRLPDGSDARVPVHCRLVAVGSRPPWRDGYHRNGARFGPAVALPALRPETYRRAIRSAANRLAPGVEEAVVTGAIDALHGRSRVPRLASIPFELLRRVEDEARYQGRSVTPDLHALTRAWIGLFGPKSLEAMHP